MIKRTLVKVKNSATFIFAVANAFNPFYYRGIPQKSLVATSAHILYLLLIVLLAMAAITLPAIANADPLAKFSRLTISIQLATTEPVETAFPWPGSPHVLLNTTASREEAAKYDIAITSNEVRTVPPLCFLAPETCAIFKPRQQTIRTGNIDVKKTSTSFLFLLLPGLLIAIYLVLLAKYAIIAAAATVITYFALLVFRQGPSFLDTAKTALFASTVLIVLDTALFLLRGLSLPSFTPLLGYLTILVSAILAQRQAPQAGQRGTFS